MNLKTLFLLYLALVLAPLVIAFSLSWPARSVWDEIASASGILAFSIILAEFLLSGRFRFISGGVGLDVTLRLHQLIARSAVFLALLHPFFYQAPMNPPRPWDTTRELTLTSDLFSLAGGIASWILLPVLVLLAIGRSQLNFKYETWRLMHGLGAALIAGLTLHHALEAGRYSADPTLRLFWQVMFGIALASLVWIYLVAPMLQWRKPWQVQSVKALGPALWELVLAPVGHKGIRYKAGQFAWINIGKSPFTLYENPFSISSAPASGNNLSFVIKELGDFTNQLGAVAPGTRAHIDGPHGNLTLAGRTETGVALIAGGVGIAPLIGILREMKLIGDKRPATLIYGNRVADQIVHRDELAGMGQAINLTTELVVTEPAPDWSGRTGLIDAALINELFGAPEYKDWLFVLCGPPGMMIVVEEALSQLGIPARQVLSERFTYD